MEILITIFCGLFFILIVFYINMIFNKNKFENKLLNLKNTLSLNFYKIENKKCSIKRLSKIDFIDKRLQFNKCNIFIEKDFVILQGIQDYFFKVISFNFIICKKEQNLIPNFKEWEICVPKNIESGVNKSEVKIIFKPKTLSNSDYSLIISDLTENEFEKLKKIENYC